MSLTLETHKISLQKKDERILKNINISLAPSDWMGVVCSKKSEKTSLVGILSGLNLEFDGELFINGVNAKKNNIRSQVGVVSFNYGLDEDFCVEDNLYLYADYFNVSKKDAQKRVQRLIRAFDFDSAVGKDPGDLTDFENLKALTIRALIFSPKVLIINEPQFLAQGTGVLQYAKYLKSIEQELSLVYLTENINNVESWMNRVVIINKGRVLCDDSPEDLITENIGSQVAIYNYKKQDLQYFINKLEGKYNYQVINDKIRVYFKEPTDPSDSASLLPSDGFTVRASSIEDVFIKVTGTDMGIDL